MTVIRKSESGPSLFDPMEVEIDGRLFRVKQITLKVVEKVQTAATEAQKGSAKAIREMLEVLIDGDVDYLTDIPIRRLQDILSGIVARAFKPTDDEKNGPRPAGDQSV